MFQIHKDPFERLYSEESSLLSQGHRRNRKQSDIQEPKNYRNCSNPHEPHGPEIVLCKKSISKKNRGVDIPTGGENTMKKIPQSP